MSTELNGASEATVGPIRESLKAAEKQRAIRYPSAEDPLPASPELPAKAARASKIMAFDATGAPAAHPKIAEETTSADELTTLADDDKFGVTDTSASGAWKWISTLNIYNYIKAILDAALTLAGAKTFTGQLELTGQSANTADSAMTRSLGDARYKQTLYSVQTSDQSVTSSTTLVDSAMSVSLDASSTYEIEVYCYYDTAGTASGVRDKGSITAGLSLHYGERQNTEDNNEATATKYFKGPILTQLSVSTGPDEHFLRRKAIVTTTSSGTFKMQFAQWVSDAAALTLKAGSYIKATKIN